MKQKICSEGFFLGGFCLGGVWSRGLCPGGFCPRINFIVLQSNLKWNPSRVFKIEAMEAELWLIKRVTFLDSPCSLYVGILFSLRFRFLRSFIFSRDHDENKVFMTCIMLSLLQLFYRVSQKKYK